MGRFQVRIAMSICALIQMSETWGRCNTNITLLKLRLRKGVAMISMKQLVGSSLAILTMAAGYKGQPHREMTLDGMVYGVLNTKYPPVTRQHHIRSPGRARPRRIDFRHGGTNPVVIELVVRTQRNRTEAYGGGKQKRANEKSRQKSGNAAELHKLARQVAAKARYLLILDMADEPLIKARLKASYAKVGSERGNVAKKPVQVVYVHPELQYHFQWPVKGNKI